jgi:uncharacterized protein YpuA (DUF1002 family)
VDNTASTNTLIELEYRMDKAEADYWRIQDDCKGIKAELAQAFTAIHQDQVAAYASYIDARRAYLAAKLKEKSPHA